MLRLASVRQVFQQFVKKRAKSSWGEDRISALPDDLLVLILMFVPTKDVVATMILSTRWQSIWKMVPTLEYTEIKDDLIVPTKTYISGLLDRLFGRLFKKNDEQPRSIWWFLEKSLQLHTAPVLETLFIQLGPRCPIDIDVGKWIEYAVSRRVCKLTFGLMWSAGPISLPKSLYTCDTLVHLCLLGKIFLDVPSRACLPSLKTLDLFSVVYKDQDSVVRILSSCPILKNLSVVRYHADNVIDFNIKVPSLEGLHYAYMELVVDKGSLVIDSPFLKKLFIRDFSGDSCLIQNNPHFNKAVVQVACYPDSKFMSSLSSVMYLEFLLFGPTVACCNTIIFSHLVDCKIILLNDVDWLEPLMLLLQHSPNLKVLFIHQVHFIFMEDIPLSWKQPSSVPGCLSAHLEIFEWKGYGGRRKEKEVVRYIFANSKRLKRSGISIKSTCGLEDREKMMKELASMSRVSTSSQLFFSTQLKYLDVDHEMTGLV